MREVGSCDASADVSYPEREVRWPVVERCLSSGGDCDLDGRDISESRRPVRLPVFLYRCTIRVLEHLRQDVLKMDGYVAVWGNS